MKVNNKIVKDNINNHILSYFTADAGWNDDDTLSNLKLQLKSFDYMPTDYAKGAYMVDGGTFLIYHDDVKEFLNGLGINPEGEEYVVAKSWELYKHLIGRQVAELVK